MSLLENLLDFVLPHLVVQSRRILSTDEPDSRALSKPSPRIPPELVSLILASWSPSNWGRLDAREAYDERIAFYKTCAQVHRSWTALALRLLRQELRMTDDFDEQLRLLRENPATACRLKKLEVDAGELCSWKARDGVVDQLFATCRALEKLALTRTGNLAVDTFAYLPNLSQLSLQHIFLHSCQDAGSLAPLAHLRHLSLVSSSMHNSLLTELPHLLPNLTALELVDSHSAYFGAFPNLTFLSLDDAWFSSSVHTTTTHGRPSTFPSSLDLLSISPSTLPSLLDYLTTTHFTLSVEYLRLDTLYSHTSLDQRSLAGYARLANMLAQDSNDLPNCPFLDLETVSLPSFLALSPECKVDLSRIFEGCHARGIRAVYHDAQEKVLEGRRNANSAAFQTGFWREVRRLEGAV
ncbi:hypothetical protein JCM11641_000233 [Rhodosporidiobolus odoratus]